MYRVCLLKSTGRLIEMQSGGTTQAHLDTLKTNAVNAGYAEADTEVKYVTDAEWAVIKADQDARDLDAQPYTEKRRREYPSIYDYIDGIVKGDDAQVNAYIDACKAVKAKYPKP